MLTEDLTSVADLELQTLYPNVSPHYIVSFSVFRISIRMDSVFSADQDPNPDYKNRIRIRQIFAFNIVSLISSFLTI